MISIHASAREATHPVSSKLLFHLISIHASAREATRYGIIKWMEFYISIHASAREATCPHVRYGLHFLYFNPRLREGGDSVAFCKAASSCVISIHASAREATSRTFSLRPISHDFNPRLREGGDRLPLAILLESCHFNPRLREGGDSCMPFSCGSVPYISIHASAREATIFPHILRGGWRISIHASAREATCCEEYKENTNPFQSTPPRGRRL